MAVTYSIPTKTARMNAVVTQIGASGFLKIGTTGMGTVLATIPLAATAGVVAGDTLTFTMPQSDSSADATGTAAAATITKSDGTVIISGLTVGLSAADVILDSLSITAGQTVTINSATIQHAA